MVNPWDAAGWAAEVDGWIGDRLAEVGLTPAGPAVVVKQWALSAVRRVPLVAGGAVVFKATCAHFAAEPGLTAYIARWAGALVPRLIAVDQGRSWMLMHAFEDPTEDPALATPAALGLAELQVSLAGHQDEMLAIGFPDRRLPATAAAFRRVVADGVELERLSVEERDRLERLQPWLAAVLAELDGLGLPDSLGHGDLHLGNLASQSGEPVIFDWTDASLTSPVIDLVVLGHRLDPDVRSTMLDRVGAVWRRAYPAVDVGRAFALAPLADAAFEAVTYDAIARAIESDDSDLQGVQARILRRLGQTWVEKGQPAG